MAVEQITETFQGRTLAVNKHGKTTDQMIPKHKITPRVENLGSLQRLNGTTIKKTS